ncbi:MAG: iron-sulfur cluster repair di-iron protein [Acidobacteria bacterium]|nr:iron-sulfur cluster repair di-iron protein [Acidobacteriota bacterium]
MPGTETTTVRDIAAGSLAAVRVFEKYGIDYCCGGKRPLDAVCREKGYDPDELRRELDAALTGKVAADRDWNAAPLTELIGHIVRTHHDYLRRELPAIQARLETVYRVYNQRYGPTLIGLPEVFFDLRAELEMHIRKEEMILFPTIAAYETADSNGLPLPPAPFGTVANPIAMMEAEHESAGHALTRIHEITRDFAVPDYACVTYRALMSGLDELERDLHLHIHLENNILFPRAAALEASRR